MPNLVPGTENTVVRKKDKRHLPICVGPNTVPGTKVALCK